MDDNNNQLQYSLVKALVSFSIYPVQTLFAYVFSHELQKTAQQIVVQIPVFISSKESRHEVFVADQLDPGK